MIKFLIFLVASMAILTACKRLGWDPATVEPQDGLTAAQYNWKLIASYCWPVVLPLARLIPGVGPTVAEILWKIFATKDQKDADKAAGL